MAANEEVHQRLMRWAHWLNVGDGSGYPVMSVLHPEWSPPTPGTTPTMKVGSASDVRATHRAVSRLSMRLGNTLLVHYAMRLPVAEQALRLECAEATVHARVAQAHRLLAAEFQCGGAKSDPTPS